LIWIKQSVILAIIGEVVAIDVSEVVSFLVLVCFYRKKHVKNDKNLSLSALFKDILPIMLTNVILPVAMFVDSLLVVNLLGMNFSKQTAIAMYGIETGAVSSLINLPTIFSFAIASVLMPMLAGKGNNFNKTHTLSVAIKIVLTITVPCVICFVFIPNRIIDVLYAGRFVFEDFDGMILAYRLLAISSFGIVFLTLNQLFSSALQAQEKRLTTIRNLLIAIALKFIIEIVFLQTKEVNIFALTIANVVCYATSMLLNELSLKKSLCVLVDFAFVSKLLLCNVLMFLTLLGTLYAGNSTWVTLAGLMLAGIVYLGSLFLTKIFTRHDLAMIKYKIK
ncbi:MAG: polysaccharide biosynthesis C-terminal domain-containing protein, partial [Clostridia bacterium]|nr:polysaccharide biosynthesis C-terminal domain-containing protein [Clostridia bacterium]